MLTSRHHLPAPPSAAQGRADPTCGLFDILARLGQCRCGTRQRTVAWAARYVQALIDGEGFPAPLPLFHRGAMTRSICPGSRWQLAGVDAWFDAALDPAASAHVDAAAVRQAAEDMDARAAALGLVLHQGGRHD